MLWKRIDTKNGGSEKMKEGRGDGREKSGMALEWSRKARTAAQRIRTVSFRLEQERAEMFQRKRPVPYGAGRIR